MNESAQKESLRILRKRLIPRVKRLIPIPILKYGDVLLQSINPIFWIRAAKAFKECWKLMRNQRVELNGFAQTHGLSAIMYFTGDISIYIHHQKMEDLDGDVVEKFTSELRKKSHTITRLPSVIFTWIGQLIGLLSYFNWVKIESTAIQMYNFLQSFFG